MKLLLPKDSTDSTLTGRATTLTFILKGNDSIGYYEGFAKETTNLGFGSMRNIIQQKQISLINNHIDKNKLTIIIKPTPESSYKNFIDALDEISINDCKHYFIAEVEKKNQ